MKIIRRKKISKNKIKTYLSINSILEKKNQENFLKHLKKNCIEKYFKKIIKKQTRLYG